jgi:hypothetical protein
MRLMLYAIAAIIGYALVFAMVVGSVVGIFQIIKILFN